MPYIITKGTRSKAPYLGFDDKGTHEWKADRLDAIRYDSESDAHDCCGHYLKTGGKVQKADDWDGHYEAYGDYEIQVYKDELKGIPGGKRWRYRFGPLIDSRAVEHSPGHIGYTTHTNALRAAKAAVDKRVRVTAKAG